jgi:uncharacterized protein
MASTPAPALADAQAAFCRYLRDPEGAGPPPHVQDERLTVYRDAILGNLREFLGYNFPCLRDVLGPEAFVALVREFLQQHRAQTPLYAELPGEFIQFLMTHPPDETHPFLPELAHFEFMESVLAIDTREVSLEGVDAEGDLIEGVPVMSPLLLPLAYRWPVHRIRPEAIPSEPPAEPTYLLYHRDSADRVSWRELVPVAARLLERLLHEAPMKGRAHCEAIASELAHPEPAQVVEGGRELLTQWHAAGIVLGTRL